MEDNIEIDMAGALASMNQDFGDGSDGAGAPSGAEAQPAVPGPSPVQEQAPASNPWDTPPKSWKQDMHPSWSKYDPLTRQYIHEREKQALDGIMQYKTAYDPYLSLEKHYKPYLERYKFSMPEITQRMVNAHLTMLEGSPEQKQQVLRAMLEYPGAAEMLQQMLGASQQQPAGSPPTFDPRMLQQAVQQMVGPVVQKVEAWEQAQQEAQLQESQKLVDSFLADPQNKYAQEAMPDMVRLVKAGLAADLRSAYEQACYLNPAIRAKLMEEEIGKATKRPGLPPKQMNSGQTPPASTKPGDAEEDMEATMRATLRNINSR